MKDLAPIAIPHGPPVESTAEYYKSLMETSQMVKYVKYVYYYTYLFNYCALLRFNNLIETLLSILNKHNFSR